MGWCRCRKVICVNNPDNDELQRLEHTLRLKEEELLRTDKKLQIKKKKLNELDRKALKLKEAKKKLSVFSKALEKCKKYEKKPKQNKKKKNEPVDVIHNFFDKILKMDKDLKKVAKVNKYDLMRRILLRPCGGALNGRACKCRQAKNPRDQRARLFSAPDDCYIMSLQRTPQLWIYHRWPRFYPQYLSARAQWKNLGTCLMFLLGILFWVPCFLCLEICICCFCSCCCDC